MRKHGFPERGEMVVCEITKINPNSAYARLLEYDKTGMIHVSEIAKRWVRNIREFVKINQLVVCRVLRVDPNYISLSIKRVNKNQADRRLQEFKRERNAEKLLEQVGKKLKKSKEQTYEETGHMLQEEFGSVHKVFEIALKNPDLLTEKGVEKKWADAIIETAKKSFAEKIYEVNAKLSLVCYGANGIDTIKEALTKIEKLGLEVRYISVPKYQVTGTGKNIKEVKNSVESACQDVVDAIQKAGGEASFTLSEK